MKTMQEVQTLISDLQQFYTDVRLLDAAAIERIEEGVRSNPNAEDLCYACHHCAVKSAFENHDQRTKLEYFSPDIVQVSAQYMEVDGAPYVLELLQRMHSDTIVEPDDTEALFSALSGYNTKLYHDPLTDMYNRRYYEEIVRGMKGPIGVALMDLDDFKVYNDTYGHHAGDMALKTAATIVRGCIRQTDALVRFGGDEFLLILPGIPEDYFKIKLEGICEKIHDAIVPGYSHMRLSTSIGGLIQMPSDSMDAVVRQADRLMYQAKVRKNCVVVSGEMLQEDAPGRREEKPQILIVDDSAMNRAILSEILCGDYRILEAADGEECLKKMQQYMGDIALVLLDLMMPKMNGFEVLDFMNRNHAIEDLPVIMISGEDSEASVRRAYEMGVSDYVARPFDARVVYRRVFNTIKLYAKQRRLVSLLSEQIRARERNTSMLVGVLSQLVEFRNGESGLHVQHIHRLTERVLAKLLERPNIYHITSEMQENIPPPPALHDPGKTAPHEKNPNQPGRLTPEEFEVIKTHTTIGADMLSKLDNFCTEPLLQTAYSIARWHHERWDGRGYPDGLKGNEIPIEAQVVALADVYDALTSDRCYKKACPHEQAVEMILNGECGAFNPMLLECFVEIKDDLKRELEEERRNKA